MARLLVAFGLVAVFLIPLGWAVAAITAEAAATAGAAAASDSLFRGLAFQWWWPSAVVVSMLSGVPRLIGIWAVHLAADEVTRLHGEPGSTTPPALG